MDTMRFYIAIALGFVSALSIVVLALFCVYVRRQRAADSSSDQSSAASDRRLQGVRVFPEGPLSQSTPRRPKYSFDEDECLAAELGKAGGAATNGALGRFAPSATPVRTHPGQQLNFHQAASGHHQLHPHSGGPGSARSHDDSSVYHRHNASSASGHSPHSGGLNGTFQYV